MEDESHIGTFFHLLPFLRKTLARVLLENGVKTYDGPTMREPFFP
jgi:hypothetical protein